MRPWLDVSEHLVPKTPRQKWIETKESWERSRHIEIPPHVPAAPPQPGGLRVAFLIYRGNPRCGGQGVYTRHLTRELVALGHSVEVFAGPPWPELDPGVGFTPVPGLDLYRDPDPFRVPHPREFTSREDWVEFGIMCTAGFGEPLAFSRRARQLLAARRGDFDVVHDNQCLGTGMLGMVEDGWPLLTTLHHPITVDRQLALSHTTEPVAALHHQPLVRVLGHAGPGGPRPARGGHRLAVLAHGHRGADAGAPRAHDRGAGRRGPHGVPPLRRRHARAGPDHGDVDRATCPMKGLVPLLEAVAKLRTERDVELTVIGRPHEGGRVDKAIARLGLWPTSCTASAASATTRWPASTGEAEVAVVPSLYEGFSLPAIEAMACGVAVVATTGGALPEVVGTDGETGLAGRRPTIPGALAGAIGRLLDDPALRARLGAAGRERVIHRFTWQVTAAGTAACYEALLEGRAPARAPPAHRRRSATEEGVAC